MKSKSTGAESHPQKRRQRRRQQCGHCQQFLINLQYHEHRRLFFDATINEWKNRPCKLVAISWRSVTLKLNKNGSKSPQNSSVFEIAAILWQEIATKSLLVYTGDLESPQKSPLKSPKKSPV